MINNRLHLARILLITGEVYHLINAPNERHDLYGEKEIESIQIEFTTKLLKHLQILK